MSLDVKLIPSMRSSERGMRSLIHNLGTLIPSLVFGGTNNKGGNEDFAEQQSKDTCFPVAVQDRNDQTLSDELLLSISVR